MGRVVVGWLRRRGPLVFVCVLCLLIGAGLAVINARSDPRPAFFIAWGGNNDPGDGHGGGVFKDTLVAGGWASPDDVYQVQWQAAIAFPPGAKTETDEAMPAGRAAWKRFCGSRHCIDAGFSIGTSPALELAQQLGLNPADVYLFGAPQPSTGVWHTWEEDNPLIQPAVELFGKLLPTRFVPAGTQVFFDAHDPYANAAPQCWLPWGLSILGHRVITVAESRERVWTGVDGAVMHEANYPGPGVLPLSGNDPSPPWAGCWQGDWHQTPNSITPGGAPLVLVPPPTPGG